MSTLSFGLSGSLGGDDPSSSDTDPSIVARWVRALQQLLPPGRLWNLESDSNITRTLTAIADSASRVESRGLDLLAEMDPRTANELLSDWEQALGLPDKCITTIPADVPSRQLAITQKYIGRGGQNDAYFITLAAACGYTATVTHSFGSLVLRAGFRAGARCYGPDWAHTWQLNVSPPAGAALSHAELECIISRVSPAHAVVLFHYL